MSVAKPETSCPCILEAIDRPLRESGKILTARSRRKAISRYFRLAHAQKARSRPSGPRAGYLYRTTAGHGIQSTAWNSPDPVSLQPAITPRLFTDVP